MKGVAVMEMKIEGEEIWRGKGADVHNVCTTNDRRYVIIRLPEEDSWEKLAADVLNAGCSGISCDKCVMVGERFGMCCGMARLRELKAKAERKSHE